MFNYKKKFIRPVDWIKKPAESLLKIIGKILYWVIKFLHTREINPISKCDRVLLIRRNNLGDAISVLPLIQSLRSQYPLATIDVLSNPYNESIFNLSSSINTVYSVPERHMKNRYLVYFHPQMKKLRQQQSYDFVIGATGAYSSATAWLAFCSPGKNKVGVISQKNYIMDLFYNIQIPKDKILNSEHQVNKVSLLAKYAGIIDQQEKMPEPSLDQIKLFEKKYPIALCPLTNRKESRWSSDNWRKLSELLEKNNIQYTWVSHQPENTHGRIIHPSGTVEFVKQISEYRVVVCIEGGASHIAPAVDCRTIVISGVNIARSWIPWSKKACLFEETGRVNDINPKYIFNQITNQVNKGRFLEQDGAIFNKRFDR